MTVKFLHVLKFRGKLLFQIRFDSICRLHKGKQSFLKSKTEFGLNLKADKADVWAHLFQKLCHKVEIRLFFSHQIFCPDVAGGEKFLFDVGLVDFSLAGDHDICHLSFYLMQFHDHFLYLFLFVLFRTFDRVNNFLDFGVYFAQIFSILFSLLSLTLHLYLDLVCQSLAIDVYYLIFTITGFAYATTTIFLLLGSFDFEENEVGSFHLGKPVPKQIKHVFK